MANGHGGYRRPEKPASVSGPGKYARRTDGGPAQVLSAAPDQAYGDKTAQLNAQRIAPMAGTAPMPPAPSVASGGGGGGGGQDIIPLSAPSQRPNEPITHGVDIGPGGGSAVLGLPQPGQGTGSMTALLQRLSSTDATGILGQLMQAAQDRGA